MGPELPHCRCLLSHKINAAADVAIGMAAVMPYMPRDQGGGQSRPGGISIPTSDHPLRDHGRVLGQRAIFH